MTDTLDKTIEKLSDHTSNDNLEKVVDFESYSNIKLNPGTNSDDVLLDLQDYQGSVPYMILFISTQSKLCNISNKGFLII